MVDGQHKEINLNGFNNGDRAVLGTILLHDQEPVSINNLCYTYRDWLCEKQNDIGYRPMIDHCTDAELIGMHLKSNIPMIAHSEENSRDIQTLKDAFPCVDWYYWYHGLIAQDWFRHWRWDPDLIPRDRSQCPQRFLVYARGMDGTRAYRKKVLEDLKELEPTISQGHRDASEITSDYSAKIDPEDADCAAIQIVLETLFDDPRIHLTEKIFKPIVMSQPFVLFAGPNSLEYLRRYGFKTYHDVWDESYDQAQDPQERYRKLISLIKHLAAIPPLEFREIYDKCLPIIEHNRKHFFSENFQEQLVEEMMSNHARAREKQILLESLYPGGSLCYLMSGMVDKGLPIPSTWEICMKDYMTSELLQNKQEVLARYPNLRQFA